MLFVKYLDQSFLPLLSRLADALKVEGNAFYEKKEYESAIEAYTRAIDTCPIKCTEKRVIYYRSGTCLPNQAQDSVSLSLSAATEPSAT